MDKEISIIGSGTYGQVVNELAKELGFKVVAFYDDENDKHGSFVDNVKVIGDTSFDKVNIEGKNFVVAIGSNRIRRKISNTILSKKGKLPTLIHPKAEISKSAKVGQGCIIHAHSYIWTKVKIDDFTIISPAVNIAHHTKIGKASFVSMGANVGASICIEKLSFVGMGSTIMTGVKFLGESCVIGAGSVVIKDTRKETTVAGNPAKELKKKM